MVGLLALGAVVAIAMRLFWLDSKALMREDETS